MTRFRWAFRTLFLLLSGITVLAQPSSGSDAGIFLLKPSAGDPEQLHGLFSQPHPKGVASSILFIVSSANQRSTRLSQDP